MAKSSSLFICQNCSAEYPKWQGQCGQCGEWGTLVEEVGAAGSSGKSGSKSKSKRSSTKQLQEKIVNLSEVQPVSGSKKRLSTGIGEFDRVLGGDPEPGIVPGAVMLIGGEPGIGKSTLLTHVVVNVAAVLESNYGFVEQSKSQSQTTANKKSTKLAKSKSKSATPKTLQKPKQILYICGEESPSQISLRISRILKKEHKNYSKDKGNKTPEASGEAISFVTSTDVDEVCQLIGSHQPELVVVDSIQTMTTEDLSGSAGSVGQLREATDRLTTVAKQLSIPIFLVGHVTKDGAIAGPKVLEHIVDAVLELSGERTGQLRILRAIKNRFGATDEVGVFQTIEHGLSEVNNPSQLFLEHAQASVPGSATICTLEGTRPLLVEVQALVVKSQLAMPRRVGRGIELSRIQVLAAVLQKHCRLPLGTTDIFVNAAGGFTIKEPALDLGLAVAMVSSLKNKPMPQKTLFIGEIGLLGEIRGVSYLDRRHKEAKRLGFKNIISRDSHKSVKDVLKTLNLI